MASRSREQTSLYSLPGVIGVEMELSALLVQGALMGVRTGGILTVDGNVAREVDYGDYNPDRPIVDDGVNSSILIALDALTLLNDERTAST